MELLGHLLKIIIVGGWFASLAMVGRAFYCAVQMNRDLKDGARGLTMGFPLFVEDDELWTADGRYFRDQFHKWLWRFFLLILGLMAAMYFNHRYWP